MIKLFGNKQMKNPYEKKIRQLGLVNQIPTGEGFVDIFDPQWVEQRHKDWKKIEPYINQRYKNKKKGLNAFKQFYFSGLHLEKSRSNSYLKYYPHESAQGWTHFITSNLTRVNEDYERYLPSTYNRPPDVTFYRVGGKTPRYSLSLEKMLEFHEFLNGKTFDPHHLMFKEQHGYSDDNRRVKFSRWFYAQFVELNYWMNGVNPESKSGIPFARYIPEYLYSILPYIDDQVFDVVPGNDLGEHPNCHDRWSMFEIQRAMGWQLMMIFAPENYNYIKKINNEKEIVQLEKGLDVIYKELEKLPKTDALYDTVIEHKEWDEKQLEKAKHQIEHPRVVLTTPEHETYRQEMQTYLRTIDDARFQQFIDTMSTIRTDIWRDANPDYYK